ncbi:MAG: cation-translocating P-type ATPase [Caldilineaceae bacterium]
MNTWYTEEVDAVLQQLQADRANGLSDADVQARLEKYGPNELVERGMKSIWAILWEQLTDVMVLILIAAAVISAFIGEVQDMIVILAIVVLNAILGVSQEYRAEQAIAALKKLAVPKVRVRRGGHITEVSARELVPGDLVMLEAGNLLPADGRVLESANLRVEEAALTGESEPVEKEVAALKKQDIALGDQRNMLFMGTTITYGRGAMIVTATGMETQLGRIADMLQTVQREATPLQRRLDALGGTLAKVALVIIAAIFGVGLFTSQEVADIWAAGGDVLRKLLASHDVHELFLTGVSMAVAAVPEGLPAMVTIALALGSQRMLRRNTLIRKLPAVETLGSVTTICSDKTGTLTENRMTVTVLDVAGERATVETLLEDGQPLAEAAVQPNAEPLVRSLSLLLRVSVLCNDAVVDFDDDGREKLLGDPTETALVVASGKFGIEKADMDRRRPRVAEVPFTSERKRMTTLHQVLPDTANDQSLLDAPWQDAPYVACTKGAVDVMLELSNYVWLGDEKTPLNDDLRQRITDANSALAQEGQRVLGFAFSPVRQVPDEHNLEQLEEDAIFIGMVGMIDPPRDEVKAAVARCRTAGIRPVMITGDHPLTAQAIARELDISGNDRVLTGQQLAAMSIPELEAVVEEVSVYARVSPEHKLNIVTALQDKHHVVAMTGDGVNDAPALKKSDIGVAMGITGTDVSKEAADMILLDDNFATIVAAVEEGRTIYDNIRKFIKYTLSSNTGELLVMLAAPFVGMPLPLIPIQILWVNLVTDGLPGLALAVEQSERGTMERDPIQPHEGIFSRGLGRQIVWVGVLMGIISLAVGYWGFSSGRDMATWRTMVFTTLTMAQMGNALAIRSDRDLLATIGLFSNKLMVLAVSLTFVLQLALIYVPFLQNIFSTTALSPLELFVSLVVSLSVFGAVELAKWLQR